MKSSQHAAAAILVSVGLGACSGGPQFVNLHEKIVRAGPAKEAVAAAASSNVPIDEYARSLRAAYLEYSRFELNEMNDYTDAIFHAERASQASAGTPIEPQSVGDRMLKDSVLSELTASRGRLVAALDAGGRLAAPSAAAQATASFDCWMEQAEEDIQPDDIAACKTTFDAAMAEMEAQLAAQAAAEKQERSTPQLPDVITLDSDVLFGFDSAKIEPAAADDLVEVAELIKANPGVALRIEGHTDSIGSEAYNLSLSERRAQSVQTFLINQGAAPERFTIQALGETDPVASNDSKEGRAQNRRVEIHSK